MQFSDEPYLTQRLCSASHSTKQIKISHNRKYNNGIHYKMEPKIREPPSLHRTRPLQIILFFVSEEAQGLGVAYMRENGLPFTIGDLPCSSLPLYQWSGYCRAANARCRHNVTYRCVTNSVNA